MFFRSSGVILILAALGPAASRTPAVHPVRPGDDPQAILDHASAGDRIVFLPGLHEHPPNKNRSILYVDKPIDIELQAGAVLKLPDNATALQKDGEITTEELLDAWHHRHVQPGYAGSY